MNSTYLSLIFASIFLSAAAQLSLKKAAVLSSIGADSVVAFLARVAVSPFAWLGVLLFGSSLALWILVLAKLPVSKAYPFVAIGIVMTSMAGIAFYGEQISTFKLISIFLIAIGVSLLAAS
jgi:multidrug transporter EmrE-like cation transporter